MGVHLAPIALERLDDLGDGHGREEIEAVLRTVGIGSLATVTGGGPGFMEKLSTDSAPFDALCDRVLGRERTRPDPVFPGAHADVWLPLAFGGLIVVRGVEGTYNDELTLASSVQVRLQCDTLAAAIGLDLAEVPALSAEGYVLHHWHEALVPSQDPEAPFWRQHPDVALGVALFAAAAGYSIRHAEVVGYC